MEKNPVFEFSEESPPSDRNSGRDTPLIVPKQTPQKKVSGRVLALAVVAVIAIIVFGGVVAIFVFRPSTSESSSDKQEIESLKQQLENLRQLVSRLDQSVNNTYSMQDEAIRALKLQVNIATQISREEMRVQLQKHNDSILELQTDFLVSRQMFVENITEVRDVQKHLLSSNQMLLGSNQMLMDNVSAVHLVAKELSTAQVNISHQLQHLQNSVLQQLPFMQGNISESKLSLCQLMKLSKILTIVALRCDELLPHDNGLISIEHGPNSLSHGLGSIATYSCDPGYALVGPTTRTCEDTNGGSVTTGTWSGTTPYCQGIARSMLTYHSDFLREFLFLSTHTT